MILDEATSNIDVLTEQCILSLIQREMRGKTVLTVAHRTHTIMGADKVLVMGDGRMLEFGEPKELMHNKESQFAKLIREVQNM